MKIFNHPLVKTTLTALLFYSNSLFFYALLASLPMLSLCYLFFYLDLMIFFGFSY